jgi:hypothetical protein
MHGAISLLPQYAFKAWCSVKSTGTTLPSPQYDDIEQGYLSGTALGYGLDDRAF